VQFKKFEIVLRVIGVGGGECVQRARLREKVRGEVQSPHQPPKAPSPPQMVYDAVCLLPRALQDD
jgi:hypothetical protein